MYTGGDNFNSSYLDNNATNNKAFYMGRSKVK